MSSQKNYPGTKCMRNHQLRRIAKGSASKVMCTSPSWSKTPQVGANRRCCLSCSFASLSSKSDTSSKTTIVSHIDPPWGSWKAVFTAVQLLQLRILRQATKSCIANILLQVTFPEARPSPSWHLPSSCQALANSATNLPRKPYLNPHEPAVG